jgi:hypothetical protein
MPEIAPNQKNLIKVDYWLMMSTIGVGFILFNIFIDPQLRKITGGL